MTPWMWKRYREILKRWTANEASLKDTVRALKDLGYSVEDAWRIAERT